MSLGFVQVKSKFWCITCTFQSAFECVKIAFARAQALLFLDELFALETALDQRNISLSGKSLIKVIDTYASKVTQTPSSSDIPRRPENFEKIFHLKFDVTE